MKVVGLKSDPPISGLLRVAPLAAAIAAAAIWLWLCGINFTSRGWNDARLGSLFGLTLGLPLYPSPDDPASTWMYGPLPLLLLWPATWTDGPLAALTTASALNTGFLAGAIVLVCSAWPVAIGRGPRMLAIAGVVICWPGASWQYLQADNFAVAVGILAQLALVRSPMGAGAWSAALLAAAGLFCKQTSLGVPVAQLLWLGLTFGLPAARDHVVRLGAACSLWAAVFLAGNHGPDAWFSLVVIPGHLPWTDEPLRRTLDLLPYLVIHLAVPGVVWLFLRRTEYAAGFALPMLTWLCAWPFGLASMLKIGGSLNTLQSFPLWLPGGTILTIAFVLKLYRARVVIIAGTLFVLALCAARLALLPVWQWLPRGALYDDASILARNSPGQVWFPWHPLVAVFNEGRRDHDEDGLMVRALAGYPLTTKDAKRRLPPNMNSIALPTRSTNWGVALGLAPPDTVSESFRGWQVYRWSPETSAEVDPPAVPPAR